MRGHIRQRGKNSWSIVLDLGRDATGKRRQKWHTVRGKEEDAERTLTKLLSSLDTGTYVEPSRLTVAEYLRRWLADYARNSVSGKTYERYEEIVRLHLSPALGHHRLGKLQPLHIQEAYTRALREGRCDANGGLSAQTVVHHHRVLREALQQAIRWLLLVRNPADAVELPRVPRREIRPLDEARTATLLEAVRGNRLFMPTLLAVATAMRRGEVLALRWCDVDLAAGSLAVRQSLEQTREGLKFKQPKTQKGRRTIALPSFALEALRRHRTEQAAHRLKLGPAYEDSDLVCPGPDGRPWSPGSLSAVFIAFCRRHGFERLRFHDLRHGHATQLLREGIHPKVVSERLGHSAIGITLDTYSHVMPDMQEEAAKKLDEALRAAMKKAAKR